MKTVIITGASSGIGKALAYKFAEQKYNIVISARNEELLSQIAIDIENKHKINCKAIACDVTIQSECSRLVSETIQHFGRIDCLINNAGISMRAMFADTHPHVLEKVMQVNFWGAVYCTHSALPYIKQTKGSVIAVSSIAGYRGLPGRTGYSASKFAMQGFFESLRTELLKDEVHVLIACPGYTNSNIRVNALTASGSTQGDTPYVEDKLMSSEEVANEIFTALQKKEQELIMTSKGKLTVFLNKFLPKKVMDKIVLNAVMKDDSALMNNVK